MPAAMASEANNNPRATGRTPPKRLTGRTAEVIEPCSKINVRKTAGLHRRPGTLAQDCAACQRGPCECGMRRKLKSGSGVRQVWYGSTDANCLASSRNG